MQTLSIKKGQIKKEIRIPTSKSYANRALILASIHKDSVIIKDLPEATDVTILIDCLKKIGLKTRSQNVFFCIDNSFPECELPGNIEIDVGEGGTTARFLAAMLLLGKSEYCLRLGERLKVRPWDDFIRFANEHGAKVRLEDDLLFIQGPISLPEEIEIDCSKTTQFATAFELLSLRTGSRVTPVNMNSSQSYWAMNERIIQEIDGTKTFEVPGDWSSASYPMAFAALNHPVIFPELRFDPLQADAKFFILLEQFNCLTAEGDNLKVSPCDIAENIVLNVQDCLDLVPTLGYFFSHIPGTHRLRGIENLIHKESDRLQEVINLLGVFSRNAYRDDNDLVIEGKRDLCHEEKNLVMPNDHRMVMVATLFLLHHSGGTVSPKDAVSKSYPSFFEIMEDLSV